MSNLSIRIVLILVGLFDTVAVGFREDMHCVLMQRVPVSLHSLTRYVGGFDYLSVDFSVS